MVTTRASAAGAGCARHTPGLVDEPARLLLEGFELEGATMVDLLDEALPSGPDGPPIDPEGVLHLAHRLRQLAGDWDAGFRHRQRVAVEVLETGSGPLVDEFGRRLDAEWAWCRRLLGELVGEADAWAALAGSGMRGGGMAGGGTAAFGSWGGGLRSAGSWMADGPRRGGGGQVDVAALERFVAISAGVRAALHPELGAVGALDDRVRADTGPLAVPGGSLDDGRRLLRRCEDHEDEVLSLVARVRQADSSGTSHLAGVAAGDPVAGTGAGSLLAQLRGSPWLDPGTDDGVVNLARSLGPGRGASPAFHRRLAEEGPGVVRRLAATAFELSLVNQVGVAVTDPGRLRDNWVSFGLGVADALGAMALTVVGAAALVHPGFDTALGSLTGQRPGRQLLVGLSRSARLAVTDPDELARNQIRWDLLETDPYRWLGTIAPEVLAEVLLSGAATIRPRPVVLRPTPPGVGTPEVPILDGLGPVAGPSPHRLPDLAEVRRTEPEWAEAGPIVSRRERPLESPETWAADLNGGGRHLPGREVNCIDCARAAEANWRGHDAVAAPLRGPGRGTAASRLEEWSGGLLEPSSLKGVDGRLSELGPGSSAMIVSQWKRGAAHAYNAVNDGGVIKWVDAQLGQVSPWPPPYASNIETVYAVFFDPQGAPVLPLD